MSSEAAKTKYQVGETKLIHRSEIKNAPYNPRKISNSNRARLRDGIKKHGLVGTLTWNKRTGNLVGGHQRLEQIDELEAKKNGDYMIEVTEIDVDENKEKAINVLLNNPSVAGEWDLNLLEGVLEDMKDNGILFEDAGFTEASVSIMFPGTFMLKEQEEQSEAELPILAEMDDIKRIAASHDAKFRDDAKSQPFANMPDTEEMSEDYEEGEGEGDEYEEGEYEEDGEDEESEEVVPTTKEGNPTRAKIDPETGEKIWTQAQRDEFDRVRKNHHKETEENIAGDTIISLVFQKPSQLKHFIKVVGMNEDDRYINIVEIERIFKVDLQSID